MHRQLVGHRYFRDLSVRDAGQNEKNLRRHSADSAEVRNVATATKTVTVTTKSSEENGWRISATP